MRIRHTIANTEDSRHLCASIRYFIWLAVILVFVFNGVVGAQTKEYIRVNGRVLAIENIASSNFSLSTSVANATVVRGGSTPITITVTPANGFTGNVALAMDSVLPGGVTAVFSPTSVTVASGSVTSTLTLSADLTATLGTLAISVKGTSASPAITRTASVNLTTALAPDFSLGGLTNLSMTAGSSGSRVVAVSPASGFASSVNFTISGLPSGVTAVFSPASIGASPWNSTINFTATAGAALGTSTVTVTVT